MAEQVTSIKSEGRVAVGKRLVEWNRKNKENLLKNKQQVSLSTESSSQQEPTSHAALYCGGTAVILVGVGTALYLYQRKKPVPAPARKNDVIFGMR